MRPAARIQLPILRNLARRRIAVAAGMGLCGVLVANRIQTDREVSHSSGLAIKKGVIDDTDFPPLLATLAVVHTGERVALDAQNPDDLQFSGLLADRVTGETRALDPRLCALLRAIAKDYPAARIELVSGYRSEKLNEVLRKKGHHVATHSQHSLGNAVDFRVVPAELASSPHTTEDLPLGVDPREMEKKIRALGWTGGIGVYVMKRDWFVHADVGPNRRWWGT